MIDKAANVERIAAKRRAGITRLRAEIERRQATGRETKALTNAIAKLARLEAVAGTAEQQAQAAASAAAAKAARSAIVDAPMIRRLDAIAAAAPALMTRWAHERAEEPKRLSKRKKHLRRVTTTDLRPDHSVRRGRHVPALTTEASTFPTGPIIPYVPPKIEVDRPGLLPGDYRLLNSSPDDFDAYRAPKKWTGKYIGTRLADAHATLRRLPMSTRPKEFGAIWPEYVHAAGELALQAGSGTLMLGRNRIIGGTSAADLARMHEALAWPMQFLSSNPVHARAVNEWAYWSQIDGATQDAFVDEALTHIAAHLNVRKVPVT